MFSSQHFLYASRRNSCVPKAVRPRRRHERFTVELLLECEVVLPEELVQNLWERCRVDVRVKRSAWLPLLTEKPTVGEYFLLRTELFEISRQRAGVSASCLES